MLYNFSSTCLFQHLAKRNNPRDYWVGHTRLPTFSNHVCLSFSLVSLSILLSWKQNVSPPSRLLQYFSFCTTLCVSLSLGFVVKSTVENIKSHHWGHENGCLPPPPPFSLFFYISPTFSTIAMVVSYVRELMKNFISTRCLSIFIPLRRSR